MILCTLNWILHSHIHCCIIQNNQEVEISIDIWVGEQNMNAKSGILLNLKQWKRSCHMLQHSKPWGHYDIIWYHFWEVSDGVNPQNQSGVWSLEARKRRDGELSHRCRVLVLPDEVVLETHGTTMWTHWALHLHHPCQVLSNLSVLAPTSSPMQLPGCFLSVKIHLFGTFHVNAVLQHTVSWVWLLWLSIMLWRLPYVVVNVSFLAFWCSVFQHIDMQCSIHSAADGHLCIYIFYFFCCSSVCINVQVCEDIHLIFLS